MPVQSFGFRLYVLSILAGFIDFANHETSAFQGLPDIVDQKQELLEKEGNVKLAAGGQRQYQVNISFEGGSN